MINITVEVDLSRPQAAVLETRQQVILDMSGQGGGKTTTIAISSGQLITQFPKAAGFIGANTYGQLSSSTLLGVFREWKRIFGWSEYHPKSNPTGDFVIDKVPPIHFKRYRTFKEYHNIISFRSGTTVMLGSLENYKAHDGKEFAWAHLDETKDTKEAALTEVILGRLRQVGMWVDGNGELHWTTDVEYGVSMGWRAWNPLYIHTSPAFGHADWLNEMFELNDVEDEARQAVYSVTEFEDGTKKYGYYFREFKNKAVIIYSSFHNQKHLPPNFLENQLENQRPDVADKVVYGLPYSKSGGEYYPSFQRRYHTGRVERIPQKPVHQAWDFNATPYMTLLCAQLQTTTKYMVGKVKYSEWQPNGVAIQVTQIRFYKEYCLSGYQNTIEACALEFDADHAGDTEEIFYYGDAMGLLRHSGLGSYTNFKEVAERLDKYIHNSSKRVRLPNVANQKRRDLVDAILRGRYPEIEIIFDLDMIHTIKDFEKVKQGPDGKLKKKVKNKQTGEEYEEFGHTSDAVEYLVCELFKEYIKGHNQ